MFNFIISCSPKYTKQKNIYMENDDKSRYKFTILLNSVAPINFK